MTIIIRAEDDWLLMPEVVVILAQDLPRNPLKTSKSRINLTVNKKMTPDEQFSVIAADLTHVEFLSNFGRKSFVDSYQCTLPLKELEEYTRVAFSKDVISDEINGALAKYFICPDSGSNPYGYSKLILSNPPKSINPASSIELQRLYVDANYRGHGLGKLLALHSESHARDQGMRHLWLRV